MKMFYSIFQLEPRQLSTSETWELRSAGSQWVQHADKQAVLTQMGLQRAKPKYIRVQVGSSRAILRCPTVLKKMCTCVCLCIRGRTFLLAKFDAHIIKLREDNITRILKLCTPCLKFHFPGLSDWVYWSSGHLSDVLLQGSLHLRTQIWLHHQ